MAKKHYADWEAGYKPADIPDEPEQKARQVGDIDWPTPIRPHMMMGWHIPAFDPSSKDTAALQLVGQLLFSESAPLYQELVVDKQWVDFVSGGPDDHKDPYLFWVFTRVKSEDLVPKVQQAIAEHIGKLQKSAVEAARLDRIKKHLRYDFALDLDSPGAVAFTVAEFLSLTGNPGAINELYAQYPKVGPKDIQRVAREVFQEPHNTVVTLSHKPAPKVPEVSSPEVPSSDTASEGGER